MPDTSLTKQQVMFCHEYLIDLNQTQAAIRAGYAASSANVQGSRLLTNDNIQKLIQKLFNQRIERVNHEADKVVKNLESIAYDDIGNYLSFYEDNSGEVVVKIRNSEEIDTRNISEIQKGKDGQFKFKLYCRDNALVQLGRHYGIFKDKTELSGSDGEPLNIKIDFIKAKGD